MTTTLTARLRRHLRVKRYAKQAIHTKVSAVERPQDDHGGTYRYRGIYVMEYRPEFDGQAWRWVKNRMLRGPLSRSDFAGSDDSHLPFKELEGEPLSPDDLKAVADKVGEAEDRPKEAMPEDYYAMARRRYASYDVNTPSVSISIPVPGPAAPAPKPKPAPQPAPAPASAPPAATAPAPEPTPRAFIFPFAPSPRRRMARGKPRRYAHSDEPAMHAAIAANPQDNTTGHAYSDMLEENGKPAHAEVVRNYIKRTGQPAMVRRRGMLDWTADPDIPWETGVMAGPVGHLEPTQRDHQTDPITESEPGWWRVHLFRRTPDRRILHWAANVNGREHAAALVRRLHAEAQQSVPPGGEVLLDHHAGNFVNLPDRYQRLARRTLTVRPHAEPESVVLLPGRRSLCVPPESPARKVLLARLRARRRQG